MEFPACQRKEATEGLMDKLKSTMVELIKSKNKQWKDLFEELVRDPSI